MRYRDTSSTHRIEWSVKKRSTTLAKTIAAIAPRIAMTIHRFPRTSIRSNVGSIGAAEWNREGARLSHGSCGGLRWPVEPQRLREHGLGRGDHTLARSLRADRPRQCN